ncbi:universal stress protein [Cupriavidus sp. WKF15]|uniref:universal stress protein n=1 Tax=Cupriavidus sp. WKF15 TaxID=3032282 RepID=UPI0023E1FAC8|nr:universal stress protein [Cupriavidus sp. WKF15]WER50371.1 universal stress protein [Cupriavidus sp. WKF15]
MSYSSILVHLDRNRHTASRLALASQLASSHGCPLIGLIGGFIPDPAWFYLMDNAALYIEADRQRRQLAKESIRDQFHEATKHLSAGVEWRSAEHDVLSTVLRESREAGLVVAGQYDANGEEGPVAGQILEVLLLESGRPVLVVPCDGGFPATGSRVMVAWNGSREATRALHDALPMIGGATARVLCAQTAAQEARPDATPVAHAVRVLERHGVTVEVEHGSSGSDLTIGELLLSRAADFDADLIVMGAYGHGRMRELVLGGVTRTLLSLMTVPVLFSH